MRQSRAQAQARARPAAAGTNGEQFQPVPHPQPEEHQQQGLIPQQVHLQWVLQLRRAQQSRREHYLPQEEPLSEFARHFLLLRLLYIISINQQ